MCECFQVGGRFIAEDPDCPKHGVLAQHEERLREAELEEMRLEREAQREDMLRQIAELRAEVEAMRKCNT